MRESERAILRLGAVAAYHRGSADLRDDELDRILGVGQEEDGPGALLGLLRAHGNQNFMSGAASYSDVRAILRALDPTANDVVVDVGAGFGRFVLYAAAATPASVIGIEIVRARAAAVRAAARRLRLDRVRVVAEDALTVDLGDATILFVNNPFYPGAASDWISRLAQAPAAPGLRIVALHGIAPLFRSHPGFVELEAGDLLTPHRFGLFRRRDGHGGGRQRSRSSACVRQAGRKGSSMPRAARKTAYTPNPHYTQEDWDEVSDSPELTEEDFARAVPASDVFTPEQLAGLKRRRGQRGPGKKPARVQVTLRLDQEVVSAFKATGEGWQRRINDLLRSAAPLLQSQRR